MRSGALTAQPFVPERGALPPGLAASGAFLMLALALVVAGLTGSGAVHAAPGRGQGEYATVVPGAGAREQQHPLVQPRPEALYEWAALVGSSHTTSLQHSLLAGRARARALPDTQSVIRLIRERQDAIITAFSHRMRDASAPGAASHSADRPRIVTRPLRGPPTHA
jgi:hypothetical protein